MKIALTVRSATASISLFFSIKLASGLLLLKLSAEFLPAADFSVFSQLLLLGALVTTLAAGGAQNGVIRQIAAGDSDAVRRTVGGALLLWLGACILLFVPAGIFSGATSIALTNTPAFAWVVPLIVGVALLSGPAQIACAALTGLGRMRASLAAQATGLVAGTVWAGLLLVDGKAASAALAFYAGSMLTGPTGWFLLARVWRPTLLTLAQAIAEARVLLQYSGAFVILAGLTAATMFGLRYVYLLAFSSDLLGYWMVAQRISDTSTQLLGLFMIQYFVPAYAAAADDWRSAVARQSWMIGTAAMLSLLFVFALSPARWVHLLLSETYLPAIGMIIAYMTGDVLRVTASLAMHAALARGQTGRYVMVEIAATTLIAAITLVLIARGDKLAPIIGYVSAYGIAAIAIYILRKAELRRKALYLA